MACICTAWDRRQLQAHQAQFGYHRHHEVTLHVPQLASSACPCDGAAESSKVAVSNVAVSDNRLSSVLPLPGWCSGDVCKICCTGSASTRQRRSRTRACMVQQQGRPTAPKLHSSTVACGVCARMADAPQSKGSSNTVCQDSARETIQRAQRNTTAIARHVAEQGDAIHMLTAVTISRCQARCASKEPGWLSTKRAMCGHPGCALQRSHLGYATQSKHAHIPSTLT